MDTITKGQRNLLLFILGCCIIFFPIKYIAMAQLDEKKEIDAECATQTSYYNELKAMDENREVYVADIANFKAEYEAILAQFPSELYQENTIMYLQGIKDDYDFAFPSVSLGQETLFYTLGTGQTGDGSLDDETAAAAVGDSYECYSASFPVSYEGSYQSLKDVVTYIENSEYRMTVDSISIKYDDEEETYAGTLSFTAYAVNGGDRTTEQVDVDVQIGKDNVFDNTANTKTNAAAAASAATTTAAE